MSVEKIAESMLRKATPHNSYLKRWVKELASADQREEAYSTLKYANVAWNTRKPLENQYDQAVYALAKALVEHRQNDGLRDSELSLAVLKFQQELLSIEKLKKRALAYRGFVLRKRYR
jgi:hypothetical protein